MAFQIRRGTNAQRLGITPLQGELIYTTDTKALYVGDGTTAGGTAVGGGGAGATDLNELTDVVINGGTLASGQVLKYDGTNWVNGTDSTGGGATTLDSLTDVVIAGTPTTGQVLKYDGTNWVNGTDSGGGASVLDDLTDVVISGTPTVGQVLKYDGTNWVNGTDSGGGGGATYSISSENGIGGVNLRLSGSDLTTDDVLLAEGGNITITRTDANTITIDALTNENEVLDFVGNWLEASVGNGIAYTYDPLTNALVSTVSISSADDVLIIGTPNDADVLKYDAGLGKWTTGTALLSDDPTPALSGNLTLNGYDITGTGGIHTLGNMRIEGEIIVGGPSNYTGGLTVVSEANSVTAPILDVVNYTAGGSVPLVNILRSRGTRAAPVAVSAGDVLGGFRFSGQGTDLGTESTFAAAIVALADPAGTVSTTYAPGALLFQIKNNAGTTANAMVINQDAIIKFPESSTVLPAVVDDTVIPKYLKIRVTESGSPVDYYIPLFSAAP